MLAPAGAHWLAGQLTGALRFGVGAGVGTGVGEGAGVRADALALVSAQSKAFLLASMLVKAVA